MPRLIDTLIVNSILLHPEQKRISLSDSLR